MNKIQLFKLLRKNVKLSEKRSPIFEQNKWAKGIAYFMAALFVFYLLLYGIIIGMSADGEPGVMITAMIIILPIDFFLRFIFQQTPAMQAKPYILLPISKFLRISCGRTVPTCCSILRMKRWNSSSSIPAEELSASIKLLSASN